MSQMPPQPPGPPGPPGGYPPAGPPGGYPPPGPPPGYPPQPPGPPGGGWGQQPPPGGQWGQPAPKGTNPLIFVVIGVVAVAVIGVGAFFVLSSDDDGQRDEDVDAQTNGTGQLEQEDGQRDAYVDALTDGYVASQGEQDEDSMLKDLGEEDLRCTAEVLVDAISVDRLEEHYTPDELRTQAADPDFELLEDENPTEEEAGQVVDGMERCWGLFDQTREQVRTQYESDPRIPEEFTSCTLNALDDEFLREVFIDDFTEAPGTDPSTATSDRIESECGHLVPGA